jgi:hypothetical protein
MLHVIRTGIQRLPEARRCQRGRDQDANLYWKVGGPKKNNHRFHSLSFSSPENVPAFIEAVKKREKTLSGFGHR